MRLLLLALVVACQLAAGGCAEAPLQSESMVVERFAEGESLDVIPLVTGLQRPLGVVDTGGVHGELLILSQHGQVLVWSPGRATELFLDLSAKVSCCSEQGLLGLALHPDYSRNGRLFVHYTDTQGDTRIVEYHKPAAAHRADPDSARILLAVEQPTRVHNGGHIQFGPDGKLYVALGDGGHFASALAGEDPRASTDPTGRDPLGNAQNRASLLGKILRIDVDQDPPYSIPADNPWRAQPDASGEVWALGLRNPWRFSFDRANGDLWIADVGREGPEEINRLAAGESGVNFGWPLMEGSRCDETGGCSDELRRPVLEYAHQGACAVIGGYRYRGRALPALYGRYIYADYCNGEIYAASQQADGSWQSGPLLQTRLNLSAFGEYRNGELLLVDIGGGVYRLGLLEKGAPRSP